MLRVDVKELAFGLFLIALALVAFSSTSALNIGTAADMGPASCRVPWRGSSWRSARLSASTSLLKSAPEPLPDRHGGRC